MPIIKILPTEKEIDVAPGAELIDAFRSARIDFDTPCGGKGTCGRCVVRILSGKVSTESLGLLSATAIFLGYVLACRTRAGDEPLVCEIPEQLSRSNGKFSDDGLSIHLVQPELLPQQWQLQPAAMKLAIQAPAPQSGDGLSDMDRISRCLKPHIGEAALSIPASVCRAVAQTVRADAGRITVTLAKSSGAARIIRIEVGDETQRHFGVAVDIGTTTIAVQLAHLATGKILATHTDYNGQINCGLDVISRIDYARTAERLEELRSRVVSTVNDLIEAAARYGKVDLEEICAAVIAGNTTMMHLLLGLNPEYIRLAPYTPTLLHAPDFVAGELELRMNAFAPVYLSPCVGSYVGGDITAGLLCTDLAAGSEEVNLFIDVGTNGEVVLGNHDFLMGCACSAGPAFEGGGIDCGMRAATGAIERVDIDPVTGAAACSVIGDTRARGICGSGMISLIANLFLTGWLDAAGKFNRTKPSEFIRIHGRRAHYVLAPAQHTEHGQAIVISEMDIENILRAKAAIYCACSLMLDQVGLHFTDINKIYIAGGFGRNIDLEKAIVIGLIPDVSQEKYVFIGNASLVGAYMVLISEEHRRKQAELARRITYLDLNADPEYMNQYTGALFLPHTDGSRFPSVGRLLKNSSGRSTPGAAQ
ncbi:MAG: ASKHA domain-containing protein [Candidatus Zhuqueibacterota bacterium]